MALTSGLAVASSDGQLNTTGSAGSVAIHLYIPQRMRVIKMSVNRVESGVLHKNICIEAGLLAYQLSVSDSAGHMLFSRQGGSLGKSCSQNGRTGHLAELSLTHDERAFTLWLAPE